MSKNAEQRALEAYPVNMTPLNYQDLIEQFGGKTEIDVNTYPRCLFQQGYEQAEKDTITKAKQWIIRQRGFSKMAIQDFQKYMEEE